MLERIQIAVLIVWGFGLTMSAIVGVHHLSELTGHPLWLGIPVPIIMLAPDFVRWLRHGSAPQSGG